MSLGMATVTADGIHVGNVVRIALNDAHMEHKEAWICGGYPNQSQWSKALDGDAPLDLWRMRNFPLRFWQVFLPLMASALIRSWFDETRADMTLVVAAEKQSAKQGRV